MAIDTSLSYFEQVKRILYYIGYGFIALFLVFILWTFACFIAWLFRIIFHQIFQFTIEKNEADRQALVGMTHKDYVLSNPLQTYELTTNRLKCLQLIVCYVIVIFGIFGVFALDRVMEGVLGVSWTGGLGIAVVIAFTEFKGLHFVSSFLARFFILWNDRTRIGDYIFYKDKLYIVMYINILSIGVRDLDTSKQS